MLVKLGALRPFSCAGRGIEDVSCLEWHKGVSNMKTKDVIPVTAVSAYFFCSYKLGNFIKHKHKIDFIECSSLAIIIIKCVILKYDRIDSRSNFRFNKKWKYFPQFFQVSHSLITSHKKNLFEMVSVLQARDI
jgi:hypothetical protein